MRERRCLLILPLAALLAVLPMILHGDSCGHDFEFHVFNWMEVGSQWRQGILLPHWEFTSAWNSGEPRFVFYPPISWVLGALLGLILPWAAVPIALIWLALTACGLTMYRLAREWANEGVALVAASCYMVHPYMLFTFLERSAYAELIAAAWLPLILLALLRPKLDVASLAVPVALLWLSNDPGAVIGTYTVAMLGTLRLAWICWKSRGAAAAMPDAMRMAAGTALGMALAAATLLPAVVEQRWVQIRMIMIQGVRVQENFLFDQSISANHRAVVRTPSIASVWLLASIAFFGLIALLVEMRRNAPNRVLENPEIKGFVKGPEIKGPGKAPETKGFAKSLEIRGFVEGHDFSRADKASKIDWALAPAGSLARPLLSSSGPSQQPATSRKLVVIALAIVAATIGFLLTNLSAPIWTYAPELKYLQFPWRFNAVLGTIAASMLALALNRVKLWFPLAVTLALAASLLLGMKGYKRYRQWCNRGNDVASLANDFYHGAKFDDTDSYLPAGADHFAMAHANPESWIATNPADPAPATAPHHYSLAIKDRLHFTVTSPNAAFFVVNLRDYPAWRITVNGTPVANRPHRNDGLIAVPIPQGASQIDIAGALTWDRIAGWPISALALGILIALQRRDRRSRATTPSIG